MSLLSPWTAHDLPFDIRPSPDSLPKKTRLETIAVPMDLGAFFQLLFGLIATMLTLMGVWFKCKCITSKALPKIWRPVPPCADQT